MKSGARNSSTIEILVCTYHADTLYMVRTLKNTHVYRFIPVKTFVSKWQNGALYVHAVYACTYFVLANSNRVSILVKGKVKVFYVIIRSIVIVTIKYILLHTVQYEDEYVCRILYEIKGVYNPNV